MTDENVRTVFAMACELAENGQKPSDIWQQLGEFLPDVGGAVALRDIINSAVKATNQK